MLVSRPVLTARTHLRLHAELLKLQSEVDLDALTNTTRTMVSEFAEEVVPFAVELSQSLVRPLFFLLRVEKPCADGAVHARRSSRTVGSCKSTSRRARRTRVVAKCTRTSAR